jgi:hypothetical protein
MGREVQCSEVKMFGGKCVLSWTYSYEFCICVTVHITCCFLIVSLLFALCLLLFVMF